MESALNVTAVVHPLDPVRLCARLVVVLARWPPIKGLLALEEPAQPAVDPA